MNIPLYLTDVQPGFVDTKMAKGPRFWVAPPAKAARQIHNAISRKRWRVYITRRWWIIATLAGVYPANIQMALNAGTGRNPGPADSKLLTWARVPMQLALIWAALQAKPGKAG